MDMSKVKPKKKMAMGKMMKGGVADKKKAMPKSKRMKRMK